MERAIALGCNGMTTNWPDRLIERLVVHNADEHKCHHVAFRQDDVDWQVWVDAGDVPLLRKLVITYKNEAGAPQYTARLSRWNFQPRLSEHAFHYRPSESASRIEFLPVDMEDGR